MIKKKEINFNTNLNVKAHCVQCHNVLVPIDCGCGFQPYVCLEPKCGDFGLFQTGIERVKKLGDKCL